MPINDVVTAMGLQTEREKIAHLLRRFGLGASSAELDYYSQGGLKSAIDKLIAFDQVDEGWNVPLDKLMGNGNQLKVKFLPTWWLSRMIVTRRPLQEKLTLFWHDHFATSGAKVDSGPSMLGQNEAIRANCIGYFQELLGAVSKDPAMLYWLDNQFNVKGKPNENFAREVMELFTLSIGHYTEKDIQEAARAFTGWSYGVGNRKFLADRPVRNAKFVNRVDQHDDGVKTILGNTGKFDGDDVLGILTGNPQTALYITHKMWEWFAYPQPEKELVERHAQQFRASGLNIKTLVRSIMEAPEFYSARAVRAIVKNPVDFCIPTLRQLGVGITFKEGVEIDEKEAQRAMLPARVATNTARAMGMELFFPPDVDGWAAGHAWISSATMVERIKWADRLFSDKVVRGQVSLRYPPANLFSEGASPSEIVKRLVEVFDAPLDAAKQAQLVNAASVTGASLQTIASQVCRLIFGAPEFQFA